MFYSQHTPGAPTVMGVHASHHAEQAMLSSPLTVNKQTKTIIYLCCQGIFIFEEKLAFGKSIQSKLSKDLKNKVDKAESHVIALL